MFVRVSRAPSLSPLRLPYNRLLSMTAVTPPKKWNHMLRETKGTNSKDPIDNNDLWLLFGCTALAATQLTVEALRPIKSRQLLAILLKNIRQKPLHFAFHKCQRPMAKSLGHRFRLLPASSDGFKCPQQKGNCHLEAEEGKLCTRVIARPILYTSFSPQFWHYLKQAKRT